MSPWTEPTFDAILGAPHAAPMVGSARCSESGGGSAVIERCLARPDGGTLAYKLHRGAGGPPLVLVHGLASNRTRFAEFAEHSRLHGVHPLLRVDLRGHGGSLTRQRVDMVS